MTFRTPLETSSRSSAKKTVLIVDDASEIRDLLTITASRAGYEATAVADGREALRALEQQEIDIVVSDWDMPRMNGEDLCRRIRDFTSDRYVYLMLVTGHSDRHNLIDAVRAGADEYVIKPIIPLEFLARLDAASRLLNVERALRAEACRDSLTDVHNRKGILALAEGDHSRSVRYRTPLSVVMMDIDNFKSINDILGHPAGDQILRTAAQSVMELIRNCDRVGRYGGDEFLLLLPETHLAEAITCAQRLCDAIRQLDVVIQGEHVCVSASFGVAECDESAFSRDELINRADQALLAAKKNGRGRVEQWDPQTALVPAGDVR